MFLMNISKKDKTNVLSFFFGLWVVENPKVLNSGRRKK